MRDEILQTALTQFLKHGIREMSIQRLVEPMSISTKTVYKYFKNKEELLEEALLLFYSQQYQSLEYLSADQKIVPHLLTIWYKAFEKEYNATNALFQDLHYYYPELEKKIETAIGVKFHKHFLNIIQKGIAEGVFQNSIHAEAVMQGIYILYDAAARTERFKPFRILPLDVLLNTIVVYIRGLCTIKGIEELDEHIQTFQPYGKSKKATDKLVNHI